MCSPQEVLFVICRHPVLLRLFRPSIDQRCQMHTIHHFCPPSSVNVRHEQQNHILVRMSIEPHPFRVRTRVPQYRLPLLLAAILRDILQYLSHMEQHPLRYLLDFTLQLLLYNLHRTQNSTPEQHLTMPKADHMFQSGRFLQHKAMTLNTAVLHSRLHQREVSSPTHQKGTHHLLELPILRVRIRLRLVVRQLDPIRVN